MIKKVFAIWAITLASFFAGCSTNDKPKVLIIGDSISYGYFPSVKYQMRKVAEVHRIEGNGQHTKNGIKKIDEWPGDEKWDLILFNWGLWDAAYRIQEPDRIGKKDKFNGQQETSIEEYKINLDSLVMKLKTTGAVLVFVTSTFVPRDEPGIFTDDVPKYNEVAIEIMNKHSVTIFDHYDKSREVHKIYGKGANNAHFTKRGSALLGKDISDFLRIKLQTIN